MPDNLTKSQQSKTENCRNDLLSTHICPFASSQIPYEKSPLLLATTCSNSGLWHSRLVPRSSLSNLKPKPFSNLHIGVIPQSSSWSSSSLLINAMRFSGINVVNISFVAICLTLFLRPSTAQNTDDLDEANTYGYDPYDYVTSEEWADFLKWQTGRGLHGTSSESRYVYSPEDDYDYDEYYDDEDYPGLSQPKKTQTSGVDNWFREQCSGLPCSTLLGGDSCSRLAIKGCICVTLKDTGYPLVRQGRCGFPLPGYDITGSSERVNEGVGLAVRPLSDDPELDPYPCCCNHTYVSFGCCNRAINGIVYEPAQFKLPFDCGRKDEGDRTS